MRILIAAAAWFARGLYGAMKTVLPLRHKIVFLSRQSDAPSRDLLLLADALESRDPDLEIVMSCRMIGETPGARFISAIAMVGQMYHLATSRACVVDGYVIPVSLLDHRPGLFVVQMWHALGAIKKFGHQAVGRPAGHSADIAAAMRMHRNYDLVLCGGPASVPVFAEAFGSDPSIVVPLGLPRIDCLLRAAAARDSESTPAGFAALREAFPVLADPDRRVVLYAPTLRRGGADRYPDVAARFADARYTLIIKPHPLESSRIEGENVVNAQGVDILDLLPYCSAVITDYSAVAFEAAVIDVPAYFYVYDIDDYARDNGLNLDVLTEMPQAASRSIGELADRIEADDTHPELTRMLKERYASAPEGCAGRIADAIIEAMKGT
jgi:CDP-ribitol ribitolphosphotransferase